MQPSTTLRTNTDFHSCLPLGGVDGREVEVILVEQRRPRLVARRVRRVEGEGGVEADDVGIVAQEPRADPVEGAGRAERLRHGAEMCPHHLPRDALDPPCRLRGGPAREGEQQDPARIDAVDDEMGDAVGQRVGLARSGPGDDQKRPADRPLPGDNSMLAGTPLLRIQPGRGSSLTDTAESGETLGPA